VRDQEALLELWQAVGTVAALLGVAWAAIELIIGVDLLGILAFCVFASIALAAVLMILAILSGWFQAYRAKRPDEGLASKDAERPDEEKTKES
jgi:TRAP-type C4-dicarboxylate transport system permease small subunit